MPRSLTSRTLGILPNGESVEAWTQCGPGGLVLEIITYGATVTRLLAPDGEGRLADVVLGFNDLGSYLASRAYIGATIGRVAGRITGGRFNLEGNDYELARNDGPNHLHGGVQGFDRRVWSAASVENADGEPSLRLTYQSPDGEERYPGTVDATITYTVTDDNILRIDTQAATDRPTPLCLTQHHYFNLAGDEAGTIADHELQIHSDEFVVTDEQMTLLGRLRSVVGQSNDFRQPRRLGDAVPLLFQNHGDLYLVCRGAKHIPESNPVPAARLVHPGSRRVLEVSTTETHLQLYTGFGLDGSLIGKSGASYVQYAGLCLECQGYPDGANRSDCGDIILRPGHPRRETTSYKFSVLQD